MKTIRLLQCIFMTLFLTWTVNSQLYTSIINTLSGPIQGTVVPFYGNTVEQYLGIPFARPPVGRLRFRKPEPVKPWNKLLVADTPGPACIQYVDYPYPWYDTFGFKSEDCLYLNIWVPHSRSGEKKAVMFWIYGGGFTVGSNRLPEYNGLALASEGDVIVVTTNYRLSTLGFLTSNTETAPGNVGLYDILEALKWLNKNIVAFGGDPNQVTISGESAGATTSGLFCVSPLTKGLFNRVILESGSPAYLLVDNNTANIEKSQRLAKALGCADEIITIYDDPDKVVNCLREKNAYDIIITESSFNKKETHSYRPNYGDEIIPINGRIALITGRFQDVDVLIGSNHDEGSYDEAVLEPSIFGVFGKNSPQINKTFGKNLMEEYFQDFPAKDDVIQYYLGNLTEYDYDKIREQVYTSMGDYSILCPTIYFAETYRHSGNNVYYYFFEHRPSTTPWANWMGVAHFEEVQFVFGQPLLNPVKYTREEFSLSLRMIRIWSNFVKYGSPGSPGDSGNLWPLYSREQPYYVSLKTNEISYGQGPHLENCNFFRKYFGFGV